MTAPSSKSKNQANHVGPVGSNWDKAKAESNWLVYQLVPRPNGKLDKRPVDSRSMNPTSFEKAAKFTFDQAAAKAAKLNSGETGDEFGVGYVPRAGSALVGVDIDDAFDSDGLSLRAHVVGLVEAAGTYLELSPSGTGLRGLLARADGDGEVNSAEFGGVGLIADGKKFFTVTGDCYGPTREITSASEFRQKVLSYRDAHKGGGGLRQKSTESHQSDSDGGDTSVWRGVPAARREAALRSALEARWGEGQHIDYSDWIETSAAIHGAMPDLGEETAREIWEDWCNRVGGDQSDNEKHWGSFDATKAGGKTVASIFAEAEAHGWRSARHVFDVIQGGSAPSVPAAVFFPASSLHGKPVPEQEWLLENWVPMGNVTSLYGDGGTGKSLLALQLAVTTVLGMDWLGASRQGAALYLSAEDDKAELHRRLDAVSTLLSVSLDDLDELHMSSLAGEDALLAEFPNRDARLVATGLFRAVEAEVAKRRPKLVVLDTLNDLYGGDENDKAQARQFVQLLRGLAIRQDCAVVLLAHPSKSGMLNGTGDSGSVAWNNSVRSRLYLGRDIRDGFEPDPNVRVLTNMKSNYGPKGGELRLRWQSGAFVATGGAASPADARAKAQRVFLDLLREHEANGTGVNAKGGSNYAPKVFADHTSSEGVSRDAFKMAMQQLLRDGKIQNVEMGPPSRRSTRLKLGGSPPGSESGETLKG